MDTKFWLDVVTEFVYNGAVYMLGYMTATGTLAQPTTTAWIVGILTGVVGAANHMRALRKAV